MNLFNNSIIDNDRMNSMIDRDNRDLRQLNDWEAVETT